ncbi:DUF4249 domain-containing protein [Winogradskyella flava]|uniref:DUF4249 domain-containing protein n=1 Tax=Winogradskyella flava TaxID=1884876 RepID=A0A842IKC1_9FLAO|nr:DUF4249 domain-containing protein [Winogradskyella flava]MBC2843732.1 DUF4249 domain-containing protein [Winogradskyella flava]
MLIYYVLLLVIFNSCIETLDPEGLVDDFESVLVIEATITNELKQHEIRLTRSFKFEENITPLESNAEVKVLDDDGNVIRFLESEPGLYLSEEAFEAQPNKNYRLSITTSDGRNYASDAAQLTQITPINEVIAQRVINNGEDGMGFFVNTFDPTNSSKFYRYEFEETYKIIAPFWRPDDLITLTDDPIDCFVQEVFVGENNERVCYGTNISNTIILTNTSGLEQDNVSQFLVHFINKNNYILTHRYSILVRQFVQSPAAYNFFETLRNLSQSDNIFSQIQPGLLVGNVFSANNENEIVLGYFDVASVSEQRIFFNYTDFFSEEPLPPYVNPCEQFAPPVSLSGTCILANFVRSGTVEFVSENPAPNAEFPGPFLVVTDVCGDCTELGSNVVPPFWID